MSPSSRYSRAIAAAKCSSWSMWRSSPTAKAMATVEWFGHVGHPQISDLRDAPNHSSYSEGEIA
jgi:hypothetical protein